MKIIEKIKKLINKNEECSECLDTLEDHVECFSCYRSMCENDHINDVPWGWLCDECFDSQYA